MLAGGQDGAAVVGPPRRSAWLDEESIRGEVASHARKSLSVPCEEASDLPRLGFDVAGCRMRTTRCRATRFLEAVSGAGLTNVQPWKGPSGM
jgi:hypothetical protein